MLVNGLYLALLFIDTVFANVCSDVYEKPSQIYAASLELYRDLNSTQCRYWIKAPSDHYIVLNFTRFGPKPMSPEWIVTGQNRHPNGSPNCMPRIEVVEVLANGLEKAMVTVCPDDDPPAAASSRQRIFHSNLPIVIVTYSWNPGTSSLMQLNFSFHTKTCEFECKDGSCLPASNLVCNSVPDCFDKSDETNCPATVKQPSIQVSGGRTSMLVTVVVVVAVLILLVVILCVFNQFRVTNRLLHNQHAQLPSDSSERNQLHCSSPTIEHRYHSEVVYVPGGGAHDRLHHYQQSQHESDSCTTSPAALGDTTNLPPSIPISLDGEEGYQQSQQLLLQLQQCSSLGQREVDRETVYAPPNRTMCIEECNDSPPPPYRAHSVGHLDKSRIGGSGRMHRAGRDCRSSPSMPASSHSHYNTTTSAVTPMSSHHRNSSCVSVGVPPQKHHVKNECTATHQYTGLPPPSYNIRAGIGPSHSSSGGSSKNTSRLLAATATPTTHQQHHTVVAPPRHARLFSAPSSMGGSGHASRHRVGSGSMSSTSSSSMGGPPPVMGYPFPPQAPDYSELNENEEEEEEEVFGFQQRPSSSSSTCETTAR